MNELDQQQVIEEEGMTLQELFHIVWLNKALIFLVTMWVFVLGIVYTYVIVTPTYTAETSLIVQVDVEASGASEASAISVAQNLISTYSQFVQSNLVLNSVIEDVQDFPEGYTKSTLSNAISISTSTGGMIIRISVEDQDPELAAEIANTLADNSIEIANDYVLLKDKLNVLDVAEVPTSPTSPNKILNLVISILLGAILSLGIVFVKELFNNKFQSTQEMEKYLGIKVIAAVPGTMKERKLVD